MRKEKNLVRKIGIFGGTFDPPHKGHIQIANFSIKKLKLDHLIWAITSKNPLKKKPFLPIKTRVLLSKKITAKNKKIKIRNYDNFLKSGRPYEKYQKAEKTKKTPNMSPDIKSLIVPIYNNFIHVLNL